MCVKDWRAKTFILFKQTHTRRGLGDLEKLIFIWLHFFFRQTSSALPRPAPWAVRLAAAYNNFYDELHGRVWNLLLLLLLRWLRKSGKLPEKWNTAKEATATTTTTAYKSLQHEQQQQRCKHSRLISCVLEIQRQWKQNRVQCLQRWCCHCCCLQLVVVSSISKNHAAHKYVYMCI